MSSPSSDLNILNQYEIVRAGAGAGKTTRLVSQVIDVFYAHQKKFNKSPKMILTTFTKKATQELKERLILKACELEDEVLIDYFSSSLIHISTIHGVLNIFMKQLGHLFQLDAHFKIMSDTQALFLKKKILKKIFSENEDLQKLLENIKYVDWIKRLNIYYENKMAFDNIYFSTQHDFKKLLEDKIKQFQLRFIEISKEIQAESDNEKWIEYSNKLSNFFNKKEVDKYCLSDFDYFPKKERYNKKKPPVSEELNEKIVLSYKDLKKIIENEAYKSENWPQFENLFESVKKLGDLFTLELLNEKKNRAELEMIDLEVLSLYVSREAPEIMRYFSTKWDYWLIDEYQDTSPIQVELLKHLMHQSAYFIVGDPQQSIYLFRGAEVQVFKNKELEVKKLSEQMKNSGKRDILFKNYRSHPELLEWINHCVCGINEQFSSMEVRELKEEETPHQTSVHIIDLCASKNENSQEDPKEAPDEIKGNRNQDSDSYLRSQLLYIRKLKSEGVALEKIAILARTNKQLRKISRFLQLHNIPTHIYSSSRFFDRREILDLMGFLKFLVNPYDDYNLILLLRSPWFRIDDDKLSQYLVDQSKEFWAHLKQYAEQENAISTLLKYIKLKDEYGFTFVLEKFISSEFLDYSYACDPTGSREANIWKFLSLLKEAEKQPGFTYLNFVYQSQRTMSLEESGGEGDAVSAIEPQRVQLMTVHASKGLEFDYVLLPFLNKRPRKTNFNEFNFDQKSKKFSMPMPLERDGRFVSTPFDLYCLEELSKKELLESQRVFYVALTRAKKGLMLSWDKLPEDQSWAYWVKKVFPLTQGLHKTDKYIYQVHNDLSYFESFDEMIISEHKEKSLYVRKPYLEQTPQLTSGFNFKKISVSRIIQENSQISSQLDSNEEMTLKEPSTSNLKTENFKSSIFQFLNIDKIRDSLNKPIEGVYLHRILESLKYQKDYEYKNQIKEWFGVKSEKYIEALDFIKNLNKPPLMKIIENGHVEWGFQRLTCEGLIEGQIDLWGHVEHKGKRITWLIDYKTGSQKYEDKAFLQLYEYAKALHSYEQGEEYHCVVVYPLEQKVSKIQKYSFPQS